MSFLEVGNTGVLGFFIRLRTVVTNGVFNLLLYAFFYTEEENICWEG